MVMDGTAGTFRTISTTDPHFGAHYGAAARFYGTVVADRSRRMGGVSVTCDRGSTETVVRGCGP